MLDDKSTTIEQEIEYYVHDSDDESENGEPSQGEHVYNHPRDEVRDKIRHYITTRSIYGVPWYFGLKSRSCLSTSFLPLRASSIFSLVLCVAQPRERKAATGLEKYPEAGWQACHTWM